MLPTQNRQNRSSIPATGLGSIVVAVPQLALVGDRAVVATSAVTVGLDGSAVTVARRRHDVDAATTAVPVGATTGAATIGVPVGPATTAHHSATGIEATR